MKRRTEEKSFLSLITNELKRKTFTSDKTLRKMQSKEYENQLFTSGIDQRIADTLMRRRVRSKLSGVLFQSESHFFSSKYNRIYEKSV